MVLPTKSVSGDDGVSKLSLRLYSGDDVFRWLLKYEDTPPGPRDSKFSHITLFSLRFWIAFFVSFYTLFTTFGVH